MNRISIKNTLISSNLDKEQIEAVESPIGNARVFAVAGSGKTRVLTHRVANLIDNGIDENSMILMSFTSNAVKEMTDRVKLLLGRKNIHLLSGTFHSVSLRFLRRYSEHIKYNPDFSVINYVKQTEIMTECRKGYMQDYLSLEAQRSFPKANVLVEIYNRAIDHNTSFNEYMNDVYTYRMFNDDTKRHIHYIFRDYVDFKRDKNIMDYSDLLLNFYDLLRITSVRNEIAQEYKHIMVDEYQDINWIQFEILRLLNSNESLFVIGDKSQCIYQFRGADDRFSDDFDQVFDNTRELFLTKNYRSTPEILALAQSSINNNRNRFKIKLNTDNPSGAKPKIIGYEDEIDQYKDIARIIKDKVDSGEYDYKDFAVLLRARQEASYVERELSKLGIPFSLKDSFDFLEMRYIKDMISFIQFTVHPDKKDSFIRTLRILDGISAPIAEKIYLHAKGNNFNLDNFEMKLSDRVHTSFHKMLDIYKKREVLHHADLMQLFLDNIYKDNIVKNYLSSGDKLDDIDFLIDTARQYETAIEFLDSSSLKSYDRFNRRNDDQVTVTTIHKVKGLEKEFIIVPNVNKGLFPRTLHRGVIDDERKLFYVAVTRAKKELMIMYTSTYMKKNTTYSYFINELDEETYVSEVR